MGAFLVVVIDPFVQIILELLDGLVDLLSECHLVADISIVSSLETMNHASPALGIPLMGPDPNVAYAKLAGLLAKLFARFMT